MKKICLVLSFIVCLLCFVGCKNNEQDVINPDVPDNTNQEQSGEVLPNEDEIINPGEEKPDENLPGENTPDITTPDDENKPDVPDNGNNEEKPSNGNEVDKPNEDENNNETASSVSDIMTKIVTKAGAEVRMPMQDVIPSDVCDGFIGLSPEDFNKYVTESVVYESMISPANQSLCIIKVNDSSKINDLKKTILNNCNPTKWICTGAAKAVVVDSGDYILLAMSSEDLCTKLVNAFGEETGAKLGETLSKMAE